MVVPVDATSTAFSRWGIRASAALPADDVLHRLRFTRRVCLKICVEKTLGRCRCQPRRSPQRRSRVHGRGHDLRRRQPVWLNLQTARRCLSTSSIPGKTPRHPALRWVCWKATGPKPSRAAWRHPAARAALRPALVLSSFCHRDDHQGRRRHHRSLTAFADQPRAGMKVWR